MSEQKSFFSTLPGILTGIAGLVTAVAGLIYALSESGLIGPHGTDKTQQVALAPIQPATTNQPVAIASKTSKEPTTDGWAIIGHYKRRCCMIQLRREWGRFSNFSCRTPQRRISAYPARPSG